LSRGASGISFTSFLRFDHEFATPAPAATATVHSVAAFPENTDTLYAGELEIRLGEGLVLATGHALTLSVREFELLAAMARRIGAIISREELYKTVWGGELRPGDRSVDVYVSKLRGKLEQAMPDRRFIHTHQGFGYRFQPEPSRSQAARGALAAQTDPSTGARANVDVDELSRDFHIGLSPS
jgi:DNA-binding winged helix-turn-helix (wHTH) protein